jgi:2'-5' RNA ligase
MKTVRVFIAISLPGEIHDQLARISAELRKDVVEGVIRWVKVTNIHLTLKFLGDIPEVEVSRLKDELDSQVGLHFPFFLTVEKIGLFPNAHRPRIVWAGLQDSLELLRLQSDIEKVTRDLGYAPEERSFSAHLTLGRINQFADPQYLLRCTKALSGRSVGGIGSFIVKSIDIYRSDLNPAGSIYTKLHSIPLIGES